MACEQQNFFDQLVPFSGALEEGGPVDGFRMAQLFDAFQKNGQALAKALEEAGGFVEIVGALGRGAGPGRLRRMRAAAARN